MDATVDLLIKEKLSPADVDVIQKEELTKRKREEPVEETTNTNIK